MRRSTGSLVLATNIEAVKRKKKGLRHHGAIESPSTFCSKAASAAKLKAMLMMTFAKSKLLNGKKLSRWNWWSSLTTKMLAFSLALLTEIMKTTNIFFLEKNYNMSGTRSINLLDTIAENFRRLCIHTPPVYFWGIRKALGLSDATLQAFHALLALGALSQSLYPPILGMEKTTFAVSAAGAASVWRKKTTGVFMGFRVSLMFAWSSS